LQINTTTSEQTEQLGERIGRNLRGGETIELVSDLGGGKTTFTRGLARAAGSIDRVASPTFTISKEYVCPDFSIQHFDFYRLQEAGIVAQELEEFVGDPKCVVVVEWGEVVEDILPPERLKIVFERTADDGRRVSCSYPEKLTYLMTEQSD